MRISEIQLYRVCIPFKKPFKHSAQVRKRTDNIIVRTTLQDGSTGYGEGLPRTYVTGEDQEDVINALLALEPKIFERDIQSLAELVKFIEDEILSQKHFPYDRENNTARCALELSLLDAYCLSFRKAFSDIAAIVLHKKTTIKNSSSVTYSGVFSLNSLPKMLISVVKFKILGFRQIKIKLGSDMRSAIKTIRLLRFLFGKSIDLRVDANMSWNLETARLITKALDRYHITSVEQPLPCHDLRYMPELKKHAPIPLMLDESICSLKEARDLIAKDCCHAFNIRLSKCGGFINSLKIAELARKHGFTYQLGCMVGETGVLSSAGRHFATLNKGYRYLEGSCDKYLLKDNIINEDISFRRGGKAGRLIGNGLCITVNREKLDIYSISRKKVYRV